MYTLARTGDTLLPIIIALIVVVVALIVILVALRKRKENERRARNAFLSSTQAAQSQSSQTQDVNPLRGSNQVRSTYQMPTSPAPEERRGKHSR